MRFRARGRSRTACGCETGHGPTPSASTDEASWRAQDAREESPAREESEESLEVPLSAAPVGTRGRIAAISTPGAPALAHRLNDLGFVTGAAVEVVRRAPLGDPVLYRVSDYEICLRKAQAAAVRVHIAAATTSPAVAA